MSAIVFIDGEAGTTGLQIKARLQDRADLALIGVEEARRKDPEARAEAMAAADVTILCLPDAAVADAVALADQAETRVIDASSVNRVADGWVYGFPEYASGQRDLIRRAKRLTNPGCYAISSVAMVKPLVAAGLLPADWPVAINAVSGYTGGGKSLVAEFEDRSAPNYAPTAVWTYGVTLQHKHVPEIQQWGGLTHRPLFSPSVANYRQGMLVQLPLQLWAVPGAPSPEDIADALRDHYADEPFIEVAPPETLAAMQRIDPQALNGTNQLRLHVFGSARGDQAIVMTVIDNLGKGASGQAVQNLNLMLGLPEDAGLDASVLFGG
ncbi:MAG: N-acetyl-gamma-glutamyl-phosphate reductase [Alphaproteobacteria bacterium]|nr:N-acetyl-gamma-glutamyl-phosphate reductase [Alphaproteobacteria bacterium]